MEQKQVLISRMDNGAAMVIAEGRGRPKEMRVYDFGVEGAARAFAERLEAVLDGTAEPLPTGPRRRILLEPAVNGVVVRSGAEVRVFTDLSALKTWLRQELGL